MIKNLPLAKYKVGDILTEHRYRVDNNRDNPLYYIVVSIDIQPISLDQIIGYRRLNKNKKTISRINYIRIKKSTRKKI